MEHFCFAAKHPGLLHHSATRAFRMQVIACLSPLHPLLVLAASDARDNLSGVVSEPGLCQWGDARIRLMKYTIDSCALCLPSGYSGTLAGTTRVHRKILPR